MNRLKISLTISFAYLIAGNFTGIKGTQTSDNFFNAPLIELLFAPYTFVAGMSTYAGWDWLSYVLEVVIFIFTVPFFYFVVFFVQEARSFIKERKEH